MKILTLVKRCVDHAAPIRIKPDGSGVEIAGTKMSMNPFDEIALEEAVRLKENGVAAEVIALSIGPQQAQDTLRHALAMGADRAVHIAADTYPEPLDVAKIIAALAQKEGAQIMLIGKQAIDDDYGHEGAMTAALLQWDVAECAASVDPATWTIGCETEAGVVHKTVHLPAVITADLRLNAPRAVPLPKVLEARKKPIENMSFDDLGITPKTRLTTHKVEAPQPRDAVVMLQSIDDLEAQLRKAMA